MKDLKGLTLADMLRDGIPDHDDLPEAQRATGDALRAIQAGDASPDPKRQRSHRAIVEEHALCWRKWGPDYVRDTTAYLLFCQAKSMCGDDHQAGIATSVLLPAVDWEALDRLFLENWESYRAERRRAGTDRGLATDMAGLEWALGKKGIPDVRLPGDLFRRMTRGRGDAN